MLNRHVPFAHTKYRTYADLKDKEECQNALQLEGSLFHHCLLSLSAIPNQPIIRSPNFSYPGEIVIHNISPECTIPELKAFLECTAPISCVFLPANSRRSFQQYRTYYAFVRVKNVDDVRKFIDLNGHKLKGKPLTIFRRKPPDGLSSINSAS